MKENFVQWIREGNLTIPNALLTNYKRLDLSEEELVLLLHVYSFLEKGKDFPTPNEISARMTTPPSHCADLLHKLIQRGFIAIKEGTSNDGIRYEKYTIEPLWERLAEFFLMERNAEDKKEKEQAETDIYSTFEQEFGRPLSPFECETLALWLDDDRHEPVIIKAALREAVISGKLNFRYIDRILFEWKKNGVKTIEQAKSYGRKFRQHQTNVQRSNNEQTSQKSEDVHFYNWLEQ